MGTVWRVGRKNAKLIHHEHEAETYGTEINECGAMLRRGIITTRTGLTDLTARLESAAELAIDTETFPTIEHFLKRDIGDTRLSDVRLLSISDGTGVWLIDCVAVGQDLSPLRRTLETKLLVIHNATFDVPFLWDKFGIWPTKIFDTLIAARVLSNEAPLRVHPYKYEQIVEAVGDEIVNPKNVSDDLEKTEDSEEPGDEDDQGVFAEKRTKNITLKFYCDEERTSNSLDFVYKRFLEIEPGTDESASNWKRDRLTDRQLVYAARMCWISFGCATLCSPQQTKRTTPLSIWIWNL